MQNLNCYVYCKRYFTDSSLRIAKCFIDLVICSLWMLIKGPSLFHIYSSGECQARWLIWTHALMILPSLPLLERSHALAWRSKPGCLNNATSAMRTNEISRGKSQHPQPLRAKITYSVHLKLYVILVLSQVKLLKF